MSIPLLVFTLISIGVFCFTFVLLFGAPFLPTMRPQVDTALDLLNLQPGQTLLELGCGDGRVLIAAARRGWRAVGYELNPILAAIAWARTRRYRRTVTVHCADYWRAGWPPAAGIFSFILPRYMSKLHKKIMHYPHRPLRVASFAFAIPEKKALRQDRGIFLYEYK